MKRKNGRRFLGFALLTILLFLFASSALRLNNVKDTMHIQGFFKEPKDTIDVIAIVLWHGKNMVLPATLCPLQGHLVLCIRPC